MEEDTPVMNSVLYYTNDTTYGEQTLRNAFPDVFFQQHETLIQPLMEKWLQARMVQFYPMQAEYDRDVKAYEIFVIGPVRKQQQHSIPLKHKEALKLIIQDKLAQRISA